MSNEYKRKWRRQRVGEKPFPGTHASHPRDTGARPIINAHLIRRSSSPAVDKKNIYTEVIYDVAK